MKLHRVDKAKKGLQKKAHARGWQQSQRLAELCLSAGRT
jgi:hypothetical protein